MKHSFPHFSYLLVGFVVFLFVIILMSWYVWDEVRWWPNASQNINTITNTINTNLVTMPAKTIGELMIVQRDKTVQASTFDLQVTLEQHILKANTNNQVSTTLVFANQAQEKLGTAKFTKVGEVQQIGEYSILLKSATADTVQIVIK